MDSSLVAFRLGAQRLVGTPLDSPSKVVAHLGAVQSQEHVMAPWAVGRRCGAGLEQVLDGLWPSVVRTHVLRTTWHYIRRDDLPLMIAATGEGVLRQIVAHTGRSGLTEDALFRAADDAAAAVRAAPGCDRAHVAECLTGAGHRVSGDLLAHVVMVAELRGEIAGERRPADQHHYHPIDLPSGPSAGAARAELARRYAHGHGPIRDRDLAWWSSLTLTQARQAIADAALRPVTLEGRELWSVDEPENVDVPTALLLGNFDELISYARDPQLRADVGPAYDTIMRATGLLFLDGALAGHWTRRTNGETTTVRVLPATKLSPRHRTAIEDEAHTFGRFLQTRTELELHQAT